MDKIIVPFKNVRGLGNIVSEKELEDFLVYMSTITSTSEEVDGITRKVYALGYVPPQVSLTLTLEKTVLDYDEHTNLIATLLDENNVGIPNEEVKFYNENSYLFYTGTTDSNGVITINVYSHQPGQHTYTGILSSDTTVTGSVTVTINKITSTLSLATSSAAVNVGGSFTLSGTLNAGSGKSVKIYQNGTVIDTVTTGTNGAYSKSITASAEGSFTYYAVFDGDSVYSDVTSSSVIVTVSAAPVPVPASMTLTSTKSILSYYDSEYAVLTATVYDSSSNPLSGQTVTMKVYDTNDTLIDTLSVTDENDGTYTASYYAEGTGDIYIQAECTFLSKTYVIEDCIKYVSSVSSNTTYEISLPSTWKFTWKYTRIANSQTGWVNVGTSNNRVLGGLFGSTGLNGIWIYKNGSYTTQRNANTFPTNSEQSCTFSCDGTNYTYERNGTSVTVSYDSTITDSFLSVQASREMSDLKVKPL